jgi:hypothetical protein
MSSDVGARRKPDAVMLAHMLEKPDEPDSTARPSYKAVVQADAH